MVKNTDALDAKVIAALERLTEALRGELKSAAHGLGLTPLQAQILIYLRAEQARRAALPSVRELARAFGLAVSTVSAAISALENKGLLLKTPNPHDTRLVHLQLTPAGEEALAKLAAWTVPLVEALNNLPEETKATTLRGLLEIMYYLQRRGRIPYVRMCLSCAYFQKPGFCTFLQRPLEPQDLRVDCPDYLPAFT